jgi:GDP-L-fucose synthase
MVAKEAGWSEIVLWGDGSPGREFLYVEDAAEGILLAAEQYSGNQPVNLGAGEEITIRALAELNAKEVGFSGKIAWDPSKPNGQPRRCLDLSRAKELFGFQARHSLQGGLRKTRIILNVWFWPYTFTMCIGNPSWVYQ